MYLYCAIGMGEREGDLALTTEGSISAVFQVEEAFGEVNSLCLESL